MFVHTFLFVRFVFVFIISFLFCFSFLYFSISVNKFIIFPLTLISVFVFVNVNHIACRLTGASFWRDLYNIRQFESDLLLAMKPLKLIMEQRCDVVILRGMIYKSGSSIEN